MNNRSLKELQKYIESALSKNALMKKLGIDEEIVERMTTLLKAKPHLESQIDWNKKSELTNDFFQDFIASVPITATEIKNTKVFDLENLGFGYTKGKDYFDVTPSELRKTYRFLVPLTFDFLNRVQHEACLGTEGTWCIGRRKNYWFSYHDYSNFIIVFRYDGVKLAVQCEDAFPTVWSAEDNDLILKNPITKEYFETEKTQWGTEKEEEVIIDLQDYFLYDSKKCVLYNGVLDKIYNENIIYSVTGEEAAAISVSSAKKSKVKDAWIKDTYKDKPVTILGKNLFKNYMALNSVKMPKTIKKISSGCFENCSALKTVILPYDIELIEPKAFSGMEGVHIFFSKDPLDSSAEKTKEGEYYEIIGEVLVRKSDKEMVCDTSFGDGRFLVPDRIKSIGPYAFYLSSKDSVYIPFAEHIKEKAFYYAEIEDEVFMYNGVKTIGKSAFENCLASKIVIPTSIELIEERAFNGCDNLDDLDTSKISSNAKVYDDFKKDFM